MTVDTGMYVAAAVIVGAASHKVPGMILEWIFKSRKTNGNGNGNGNGSWMTPNFRREMKEIFSESIRSEVLPLLSENTRLLQDIANATRDTNNSIIRLVALEEAHRDQRMGSSL